METEATGEVEEEEEEEEEGKLLCCRTAFAHVPSTDEYMVRAYHSGTPLWCRALA